MLTGVTRPFHAPHALFTPCLMVGEKPLMRTSWARDITLVDEHQAHVAESTTCQYVRAANRSSSW